MENLIKGFKENKAFRLSSILVFLLLAITVLTPFIAPYDPLDSIMREANSAPSAAHLFGTDKLGRDVLSRILYGASYSLTSVLGLVAVIFVVGTMLGVIAGYFGGVVDVVIMRIADMMISFPGVILAIAIAGILGGSLINAMIAMLCVTWTKYARLARSMVLKIKKKDFVDAAVVSGGSALHILWVHILPNILPLMIITAAADIGAMMMELAGLSSDSAASRLLPNGDLCLMRDASSCKLLRGLCFSPGLRFLSLSLFLIFGEILSGMCLTRGRINLCSLQ